MIATYTLNPNEINGFLKIVGKTYAGFPVRITIESFPGVEPPEETRARMLRALEAEKHGNFVHTMTIDELEAMAR